MAVSQKPLVRKLGIKAGQRLALLHSPKGYTSLLGDVPQGVTVTTRLAGERFDLIQAFYEDRKTLKAGLTKLKKFVSPEGKIWVCWRKGGVTDLSRGVIHELGGKSGLDSVAECAIDADWSAMRLKLRGLVCLLAFGLLAGIAPAAVAAPGLGLVSVWIPKVCPDELRNPGREAEWNACFNGRQNPEFEKAKRWYADVLGFQVTSDVRGVFDGVAGRWIQLKMPGQTVEIVLKAGRPVTTDASFTLTLPLSDELCGYHAELVRRGVELDPKFGRPTHRPWAFEFAVRDPNRQQIVINVSAESLAREEARRRAGKLPPRRAKCGDEL